MPGPEVTDALAAAERLKQNGIATIVTHLGENVANASETGAVRDHYLEVLDQISSRGLDTHISVKLTELGLDQDPSLCSENLKSIAQAAKECGNFVWIDMEGSKYTSATLEVFRNVRSAFTNLGVCLQAYLFRTADDLAKLLALHPAIRLVKGAYAEPPDIAFSKKSDTDENFYGLAKTLLDQSKTEQVAPGIATHDLNLIRRVQQLGVNKDAFEVQMLYGIRSETQQQLVREGHRVRVLISYGTYWFPWYMRRLAERPANVWFVVRNLLLP